jgi:2Fe-2S ferredoxin
MSPLSYSVQRLRVAAAIVQEIKGMADQIQITVTNREGMQTTLRQAPGQDTLMQVLFENEQGVEAVCGGCASCATCHVFIQDDWVERIPPRQQVEDLLLTYSDHFDARTSRLSCQIQLTADMDGLSLTVAPEE